ncbi:MAG: Crp/Fnr family transcriptional regulator [Oceanospirillaceae bacterium]|nr:Crp/Fnr family transcriptional regulator [Oceanospirillaceae bacterium]
MINILDEFTAASVLQLIDVIEPGCGQSFKTLIPMMSRHDVCQNEMLFQMGQENQYEYILLNGLLRSFILDVDGNEVTVAFYTAPCVITPCIARSDNSRSLVSCEAIQSSRLVRFSEKELVNLMVKDESARRWGNQVLQAELIRRARREWSLAAESGAQRLARIRMEHPDIESVVTAKIIATYLGITPVSLSRLRSTSPTINR